jgi:hypothetical protein
MLDLGSSPPDAPARNLVTKTCANVLDAPVPMVNTDETSRVTR